MVQNTAAYDHAGLLALLVGQSGSFIMCRTAICAGNSFIMSHQVICGAYLTYRYQMHNFRSQSATQVYICKNKSYIYICIYICIYTYICIYIYIYIHRYIYIYIYVCIYIYTHIYIYTYTHTYIYTDLHIYICTYVHTYIHIYIYMHFIYTYICIYMCIYIYINDGFELLRCSSNVWLISYHIYNVCSFTGLHIILYIYIYIYAHACKYTHVCAIHSDQ